MTSLCPRCSTPRAGDYPICQVCGLDFRSQVYQAGPTGAAPGAATGAPTPASPYGAPPAPFAQQAAGVCPRCRAPLYPGYTMCGNCGFDSAQPAWGAAPTYAPAAWGSAAPAVKPAGSKMPILLALGGIVLLAVAGGLVLAATNKGGSATARPSASAVALASPTNTPTPTSTPRATRTAVASSAATAEPTLADNTPEPSPLSAWTSYVAPDKTWSIKFPSAMTPIKQSMPLNSGLAQGDMTMYVVVDSSGGAYAVAYFDFAAGTIPTSASSLLKTMEATIATGMGGTLITSTDATLGGSPARDLTIQKGSQTINLRLAFVGDRFYLLMVMAESSATTYPQHYFSTLTLK